MKVKIFILSILAGVLALSMNAQNNTTTSSEKKDPCNNCESVKDTLLLKLNENSDVVVERRNSELLGVSMSKEAKSRKNFDCPDIFAPPPPKAPTPPIEKPKPKDKEPEIKPVKGEPFFLPDPVFFRINKYVIDQSEWAKIELAVNYLKEHPNATCVVTGYADKKTGNNAINLRLSRQRSNAVADAMERKYGINKNRLSVNWKGDGIQPFELENDKNRAVLFLINP